MDGPFFYDMKRQRRVSELVPNSPRSHSKRKVQSRQR